MASASPYDLLIIGGGIVGAGIAWDAALRGLSSVLVEQDDFASGTSSKTTKLVHGGIRYLENLELKLVRESIRERGILFRKAPHLVSPLPFLIPVVGNRPRPWWMVKLGVLAYDWLAGKATIRRHRFLTGAQATQNEPILAQSGVQKAAVYYDAQMDDARLVLETLKAASRAGALVHNHCQVVGFVSQGGKILGVRLQDRLTGSSYEVEATVIVNATGPWADRIRRLVDPTLVPLVRPSKGIHLVYPDLGLRYGLVLSAQDRRIFFLIPWNGLTLIGTTDTDFSEDPGTARAQEEEVTYLLEQTNRLLPGIGLSRQKIISTFAGIRPLVAAEKKDPSAISRGHLIQKDASGLVNVIGGKFTTFRKIAQDVVDTVVLAFPMRRFPPCTTATQGLGPQVSDWRSQELERMIRGLLSEGDIYPPLVAHMIRRYGEPTKKILRWMQEEPHWGEPICEHHPFVLGEVRYSVEEEMAVSLSDLFWRRFGIGHSPCHGLDALEKVARVMMACLGWSDSERQKQIKQYQSEIQQSLP